LTKRIRGFLKGLKPKTCIVGTILFIIALYIFLFFFQKTLNLVEYELFAWLPTSITSNIVVDPLKSVGGINSNQLPDNIIQNS